MSSPTVAEAPPKVKALLGVDSDQDDEQSKSDSEGKNSKKKIRESGSFCKFGLLVSHLWNTIG